MELTPTMRFSVFILAVTSLSLCGRKSGSAKTSAVKTYESVFAGHVDSLNVQQRQALYTKIVSRLDARRQSLQRKWNAARTDDQKKQILGEARKTLMTTLCDSLLVCWYGTPWNFNGTTDRPGEGKIACGYFVTTTLKQAGFNLDRVYFAQQASSVLINKICDAGKISIHGNSSAADESKRFAQRTDGLYLLGMDDHIGYVKKQNDSVRFVHSCPWPYNAVGCEIFTQSKIINASHYFMTGNLLASDATLVKWINGEKIE